MKSVGRGLALVLGHAVQFGVCVRPNGDRIEKYFVVLGEIGGGVAIDECRPSGPAGLEQRSVREKPRHRLHVPYLFSPTANDLTGLKHPAAARLSARGKRTANNQHSEPIIEKIPEPSVRHPPPSVEQCESAATLSHSRSKCDSFWLTCEHQGMQFALADHPADLPEGEEWDQCDSKDDSHKKHSAWSSAADNGDALANRLPLEC